MKAFSQELSLGKANKGDVIVPTWRLEEDEEDENAEICVKKYK